MLDEKIYVDQWNTLKSAIKAFMARTQDAKQVYEQAPGPQAKERSAGNQTMAGKDYILAVAKPYFL